MRNSLCVIARNEERNLSQGLADLRDLFHEIVVVDTGSTDQTKHVATSLGAKVFEFPWPDSFAAARNEALRRATGDWIFWLDADDRIDRSELTKLKALFASLKDDNAAYLMRCVCPPAPGEQGSVTVEHARLFRKLPGIEWRYRVHEQILLSIRELGGEVRRSDVIIKHIGYQNRETHAGKLERNLRLLRLDHAEHPHDAYILFNLGWTLLQKKDYASAAGYLRESLAKARPGLSVLAKAHSLLAQTEMARGDQRAALTVLDTGLQRFPADPELLFLGASLHQNAGRFDRAEQLFRTLLASESNSYMSSLDDGVQSYKAHHNLAVLLRDRGRIAEAEAQFRAAIAARSDFAPALLGLGELLLAQRRSDAVNEVLSDLLKHAPASPEAAALRARHLAFTGDYAAAYRELDNAIGAAPQAVTPRLVRSQLLLKEGKDWPAAEKALRSVLELVPEHGEAKSNLKLVLMRQGRTAEAVLIPTAVVTPASMQSAPQPVVNLPPAPDRLQGHDEALEVLLNKKVTAQSILELGCGSGVMAKRIRTFLQPKRYVGIDADASKLEIARSEMDEAFAVHLERVQLTELLEPASFELVIALDVLATLTDPSAVLTQAVALLQPGGHALVSLGNIAHWSVLESLADGQWNDDRPSPLDQRHLRFFTYPQMRALVHGAGLRILHTEAVVHPHVDVSTFADAGNTWHRGRVTLTGLTRDEMIKLHTWRFIILARKPKAAG